MTLQVSGPISILDVNVELQQTSNTQLSLNDAITRNLAGKPSGTIAFSDLYGKTKYFYFTDVITTNRTTYNVKTAAVAAGWDLSKPLHATITVNSGIVVGGASISSYAFDTGTSFTTGSIINLVNNGYIVGAGGKGADSAQVGGNGGPALIAQYGISITNNGTIGGGGGGGGAGSYITSCAGVFINGAAGGGGAGYVVGIGGTGAQGTLYNGVNGTTTTGGVGGPNLYPANCGIRHGGRAGAGGTGGTLGVAGAPGVDGQQGDQGGGGFSVYNQTVGGSAGTAVVGNSNINWLVAGSRLGNVT